MRQSTGGEAPDPGFRREVGVTSDQAVDVGVEPGKGCGSPQSQPRFGDASAQRQPGVAPDVPGPAGSRKQGEVVAGLSVEEALPAYHPLELALRQPEHLDGHYPSDPRPGIRGAAGPGAAMSRNRPGRGSPSTDRLTAPITSGTSCHSSRSTGSSRPRSGWSSPCRYETMAPRFRKSLRSANQRRARCRSNRLNARVTTARRGRNDRRQGEARCPAERG